MLFLTLSNTNLQFVEKELKWKSYIIAEVLLNTKSMELIDKREFVATALDKNVETFVIHIAISSTTLVIQVYPSRQAQVGLLLADKALSKILSEYLDYNNVFSFDRTMELPENTSMNKYTIKLVKDKQPLYELIYSLGLVKLETLKTYIETHLKTGFIQSSKSPTGSPIFFDQKSDKSLRLCVNYRDLNNLTIKN